MAGKQEAQRDRKRKHPLAHGNLRNDVIHQVDGRRIIDVDPFVWDDFGTVFGVGREYAMKTNQVKSGTRAVTSRARRWPMNDSNVTARAMSY